LIAEKPLAVCGCRKFKIDALGDHLCTCTAHSGAKKAHDWAVGQLADLFRTTHTSKTQQVVRSRGQHCGDVELVGYLANAAGPVPLVLDLRITHDRFGSSSDPTLNGTLHYPNPHDIDRSLNEASSSSSSSNPVYVRHVDSSYLGFSLSSHRQSYIDLVFSSRFID
jgi:hypothetical protein